MPDVPIPFLPRDSRLMALGYLCLCVYGKVDVYMEHEQSPEVEIRLVFFPLQMLRFSALCGPNEQIFGELLT